MITIDCSKKFKLHLDLYFLILNLILILVGTITIIGNIICKLWDKVIWASNIIFVTRQLNILIIVPALAIAHSARIVSRKYPLLKPSRY